MRRFTDALQPNRHAELVQSVAADVHQMVLTIELNGFIERVPGQGARFVCRSRERNCLSWNRITSLFACAAACVIAFALLVSDSPHIRQARID